MFAKKNRFSFKNKLPKLVFNSPSFSVRYEKNDEGLAPIRSGLKVAVVVSKKVDNRATVRNKIKRVLIESIKKNVNSNMSLSLIFYARKNILNSENLNQEIKSTIDKIKK